MSQPSQLSDTELLDKLPKPPFKATIKKDRLSWYNEYQVEAMHRFEDGLRFYREVQSLEPDKRKLMYKAINTLSNRGEKAEQLMELFRSGASIDQIGSALFEVLIEEA